MNTNDQISWAKIVAVMVVVAVSAGLVTLAHVVTVQRTFQVRPSDVLEEQRELRAAVEKIDAEVDEIHALLQGDRPKKKKP